MDLRRDRLDAPLTPEGIAARLLGALVGVALVLSASWSAAGFGSDGPGWGPVAVVALCVVLAWTLPATQHLLPRPGDAPLVLVAPVTASYLCVPETDQLLRVAVVVAVVTLAAALARRRVPLIVLALLAAYVLWAGVFGSAGRASALVGALVAWWPVVLLPLMGWWRPALAGASIWARGLVVVIGAAASIAVARTGALEPTLTPALAATAIALPASLAVAVAITALATRARRR
ncbi:MAG: hypothetical protein WD225_03720 [Ilumatobacteraceae bacterium]